MPLDTANKYYRFVEITVLTHSAVRDPKDLYLLSLAETIKADYLVSGDADLIILEQHKSTQVVRLSEFQNHLISI